MLAEKGLGLLQNKFFALRLVFQVCAMTSVISLTSQMYFSAYVQCMRGKICLAHETTMTYQVDGNYHGHLFSQISRIANVRKSIFLRNKVISAERMWV